MSAPTNEDGYPILVKFQHGALNYDSKEEINFKYMRSKVPTSKKRMLVAETTDHSYTGMVTKKPRSIMKYYIGIVDEETNCIEDITPCRHCMLKPKLQKRTDVEKPPEMLEEETFREKRNVLIETFGTAKQKRVVAARKKNEEVHLTISDKVSDVAKKIIAETPFTPSTPDQEEEYEESIFPPLNKAATKVEDMYHVDDIISFREYNSLKKLSNEMQYFDDDQILLAWKKNKKYPDFVLRHLCNVPSNNTLRDALLCYLFYMNQMIVMYRFKPALNKADHLKIPEELRKSLFDKFTHKSERGTSMISKKMKDKLLCHILVLALIIEHFEMDCHLLLKDLRLGLKKASRLLRAIGCVVKRTDPESPSSGEIQLYATLQLPKTQQSKTPKKEQTSPTKEAKIPKKTATPKKTTNVKREPQDVNGSTL